MNVTHEIAEKYGDHLLARTGWGNERLAGLHNVGVQVLDDHREAISKALQVNPNLKEHVQAKQIHELLSESRSRNKKRLADALNHYMGGLATARENFQAKVKPAEYDSSIEKLHDLMLKQEIRAELRQMDTNERITLIRESVRNGDRTLLDAVRGPVKPVINPNLINGMEETYARAVAQDELNQVQVEEDLISQAEGVIKNIERHLGYLEKQEKRLPPAPEPEPAFDGWSTKAKSDFIKKYGQDAYLKVSSGEADLSTFQE